MFVLSLLSYVVEEVVVVVVDFAVVVVVVVVVVVLLLVGCTRMIGVRTHQRSVKVVR